MAQINDILSSFVSAATEEEAAEVVASAEATIEQGQRLAVSPTLRGCQRDSIRVSLCCFTFVYGLRNRAAKADGDLGEEDSQELSQDLLEFLSQFDDGDPPSSSQKMAKTVSSFAGLHRLRIDSPMLGLLSLSPPPRKLLGLVADAKHPHNETKKYGTGQAIGAGFTISCS